jgi:hypothetical protein
MSDVNEFKLTDTFTVAVGHAVNRAELDKVVETMRNHGSRVRVFDPVHCMGTMDYNPGRMNIYLDAQDVVTRLKFG